MRFLRWAPLAVTAVCACTGGRAQAQSINVPNFSFENPTTTFVTSVITNWTQTAQPASYDPATNGGYPWSVLTGVFLNTSASSPDHIDNLVGTQAALMFGVPELGIYQELSSTYQVGKAYHLTLGLVGQGGGMLAGVTLNMQLYYRTSPTTTVVIGNQVVTHTPANFPNHTHVYDFTLDLPAVLATDAWAGQPIGIEFLSTANSGNQGGYWDLDNVRLMATPLPEPTSAALLVFGGIAVLHRRSRRA